MKFIVTTIVYLSSLAIVSVTVVVSYPVLRLIQYGQVYASCRKIIIIRPGGSIMTEVMILIC